MKIDTDETLAKFRESKLREFRAEVSEFTAVIFHRYIKLCEKYGCDNMEREIARQCKSEEYIKVLSKHAQLKKRIKPGRFNNEKREAV